VIGVGAVDISAASIGSIDLTAISLGETELWSSSTEIAYRYYRFEIIAIRIPNNDYEGTSITQMSELVFLNGSTPLTGMTITQESGTVQFGEEVDKLGDGDVNTKFLSLHDPSLKVIYDFGVETVATGYRWATANDGDWRDPITWVVSGSNNGSTWTTIDSQTNYNVPVIRQIFLPDFTFA
jgi:hypothetical protein